MFDLFLVIIVKEGGILYVIIGGEKVKMNLIVLFYMEEKFICGYFFSC